MSSTLTNSAMVVDGSNCFRQRIVVSTLSGRQTVIRNIRIKDEEPGIKDHEVNFLKMMEAVTNGTTVKINATGTTVDYKPGLLHGGEFEHDCGTDRSISYYLEALFALAPFCKYPIQATLKGITNDHIDPSVDALKNTSLSVIKRFLGAADDKELQVTVQARGLRPKGGGQVFFTCPIRRSLRPVQLLEPGKIKRIRGCAYASRVNPQMANRMVDVAKGIMLKFIPDVWIAADHKKGKNSGLSPGFGICLVAETTNGVFYTGESVSNPQGEGAPSVPEDVARAAAHNLFEEIYRGGCVDSLNQGLFFLLMALCSPDLSKVITGPLSPYSIQLLRHMKQFFGLTMKLELVKDSKDTDNKDDEDGEGDTSDESGLKKGADKISAACIGIGYSNISKRTV